MVEIPKELACMIIESVGSSGIPPKCGLEFFTVGLDDYIKALREEYFRGALKGTSTAKLVIGAYGGGKTHFLYTVRDLSWSENFVVSYVSLNQNDTPFYKIENVYSAIVKGVMRPLIADQLLTGEDIGIESVIKYWYDSKVSEFQNAGFSDTKLDEVVEDYIKRQISAFDSTSFTFALRNAFNSLHHNKNEDFDLIMQWMKGEGWDPSLKSKFHIVQKVDKQSAPSLIRSVAQWINFIGFNGIVILFDEAERVPSLNSKQADQLASNLREFIDETKRITKARMMVFYAVPDDSFLQRRQLVYEALNQRFRKFFKPEIPTGTKIDLAKLMPTENQIHEFLHKLGRKLSILYSACYGISFNETVLESSINNLITAVIEKQFGEVSYKRLFVQSLISMFDRIRIKQSDIVTEEDSEKIVNEVLKGSS